MLARFRRAAYSRAMTTSPILLILAGKRDGRLDPLAADAGVSHKCRVPICGKALLQWVLEAAIPAFPDTKVLISIHDPAVIADLPGVLELQASGRLIITQAQAGIVESVEHAAAQAGESAWPMLITTADNVLVTAELMRDFHAQAVAGDGDAVIVLATREVIHAAHPEGQRRFYEFADAAISNCTCSGCGMRARSRQRRRFARAGNSSKPRAGLPRHSAWSISSVSGLAGGSSIRHFAQCRGGSAFGSCLIWSMTALMRSTSTTLALTQSPKFCSNNANFSRSS